MAAKAVYASCTLAVYVTRDELERLMRGEHIGVTLYVGDKVQVVPGVSVLLAPPAREFLAPLYAADRAIYDSIPRKPSGKIKDSHYKKRRVN